MKKLILFFMILLTLLIIPLTTCFADIVTGSQTGWEAKLDELAAGGRKVYSHPFMLADSERLEKLSHAGSEEPWKTMKENALKAIEETKINRSFQSDVVVLNTMYDIINYNTLGYILDPQNSSAYKKRVLDAIAYFDKTNPDTVYGIIYDKDGDNWNGSIPPGNTFASAVIALDIIYPSLTQKEIADAEAALQCVADAFWANDEAHLANTWGVRGIWAAYMQDYELLKTCYDEWLYQYHDSFNSDGGQLASVEYAYLRYAASERNAKILLPYIMEYMEIDDSFFTEEKNINAMEHLLGYTYAPNGKFWLFGDTIVGNGVVPEKNLAAYVAPKHSAKAAGYGAFLLGGNYGNGTMLKLLLGNDDGSVSEPIAPTSRIYNKTGAFFYENYNNKNSLAGVMYNQTKTAKVNGHSHTEANSIGIYAYGNMLMANSGYAGFAKGTLGYTWRYIQTSAASANTVLINYDVGDMKNPSNTNDHRSQWGYREPDSYTPGIVSGFTHNLLCYAKGDSGVALPNGKHYRSFVMVSSQDYTPGYFVEFDEILTQNPGDVATVIQRPMSDKYSQISENEEYEWKVSAKGSNDVNMSVYLVHEPDSIEIKDAIVASTSTSIPIKSMFAKYASGSDNNIRVSTVLFPSDINNSKADMKRITAGDADGVKLSHKSGATDYIFSSKGGLCEYYISDRDGIDYTSYDKLTFEAKNIILRKKQGISFMYFAEDGKKLISGEEGFEADKPVNVFAKDTDVTVEAHEQVNITFIKYGITGILINGIPAENAVTSSGKITVTLEKGTHTLELVCNPELALEQMLDGKMANSIFDNVIVIDTVNSMMLSCGRITKIESTVENGTAFISHDAASLAFGGEYAGSIPLRHTAEEKGYTVMWHNSGLVFVVKNGAYFSFETDSPILGFALEIFGLASKTDYVTDNVPDIKLYINGREYSEFDPCIYNYTTAVWDDTIILTAEGDSKITIEDISDTEKLLVTDNGINKATYTFKFRKLGDDDIFVTASAEPQSENSKENTLDGDINTRWSADGSQWICYELSKVKTVSDLSIAWYLGDQRLASFKIEISIDGEIWQHIYTGSNSGTTVEPESVGIEPFDAKFIRLRCNGTTANAWNSITEVIFDFEK